MQRIRNYRSLPARERILLLQTAVLVVIVRVGSKYTSIRRLNRRLSRPSSLPVRSSDPLPIERIVWGIEVATRVIPGTDTCLVRALATRILLSWYRYDAHLRIGVAHGGEDGLEAHAWVERDGSIVIGKLEDQTRYAPLPSMDGEPA